jgi:putative lipoprotein
LAVFASGCGTGGGRKATAKVTGTVTYLQRVALPPDAELHVVLEDISLQDAPAGVIGEQTISTKGKQVPIPFAVEYDAKVIEDSHAYSIRAEILVGGERKFVTTQSYPVLTREAPTNVDVIVMALQAEAPAHTSLVDTHWTLVELLGRSIAKTPTGREPYLMLLEEESRAVATGGCNQMTGSYSTSSDETGTKLAFSQFAATTKACPDGMDRDQALGKALQATTGCRIDGSRLELLDASGAVLARFEAAALEE